MNKNPGSRKNAAPAGAPRPLAMVKAQQDTIQRSLKLPFSGTIAAIILVILVVLGIGAWLIFNQTRTIELTLATGPATGRAYAFGEAYARVVAEAEPRLHITVVETEGTIENMRLLQSGEVDLALGQTDVDAGSQIRTVAFLYPELFHLAVRVGLDVQSPADLKGLRVATPPESSGSYNSFQFVMSHYGIQPEEITLVPLSAADINPAFLRGEVDAVFRNLPLGEPMTRELLATGQAQLIQFDQVAAMQVPKPYIMGITIPMGTYRAADPAVPDRDLNTIGVQNVLYANADLADTTARSLTRVLFEHQNALVSLNQWAAFISSPLDYDNLIGPALHPGALAYYDREKPNFFQRYYNEITFLFMVAPLFGSIYVGIRARMAARQKKQVNTYQQRLIALMQENETASELTRVQEIEHALNTLLTEVLRGLDEGQFEVNDLQTFSFGWDKAIAAVRHHQEELSRKE